MSECKQIKHEYQNYGYENITPNYCKNTAGIYQMQTVDNSTYLEVYCHPSDIKDVQADIERHVDGVESIYPQVDKTDSIFVLEGNEEDYYTTYNEALLHKLDPDEELHSLVGNVYTYALSNKCDDTVTGYSTGRTQYTSSTIDGIITNLIGHPYIHKLDKKLSQEQKEHLYELSLRIQEVNGWDKETREVVL